MICFLCSCLFGASSVPEGLQQLPWSGVLPIDSQIGSLSDPLMTTNQAVAIVFAAFRTPYGPEWYERFVASEARVPVNRMHDKLLASILPAVVSIGPVSEAPFQAVVAVKIHREDGTFLVLDAILSKQQDDSWAIVALTVR